MKIIDAHLHIFPRDLDRMNEAARRVGHQNSVEHLRQVYSELGIVHGVVMANRNMADPADQPPADLFHFCAAVDVDQPSRDPQVIQRLADSMEAMLRQDACCGAKIYAGYKKIWLSDPIYEPVYQLAAHYRKPVAIHMGFTANERGHLKYCHPLALDEVAADHPDTQFVMCHFGNPFLECAAAVVEKNPNVFTDLSGLLEGRVDLARYRQEQSGYLSLLQTWLTAIESWDKIMFGTDWPIVNLGEYINYIQMVVPEAHWEDVFFNNANRIYRLGL